MKATVDADTCTACELCIDTCPEVFELADDIVKAKVDSVPADAAITTMFALVPTITHFMGFIIVASLAANAMMADGRKASLAQRIALTILAIGFISSYYFFLWMIVSIATKGSV